jgi:hypothetical protein
LPVACIESIKFETDGDDPGIIAVRDIDDDKVASTVFHEGYCDVVEDVREGEIID